MNANLSHEMSIRVASYNVRNCVGLDRRKSPERVLEVISEMGGDVVALQEADARVGAKGGSIPRDLIARETDFEAVELDENSPSLGWHANAVLVRKGTRVTLREGLHLPSFEARGALMVEIERNGRPLRIVATHLGLLRRYRRRQLASIVEQIAQCEPMATVILGDFNEWSATKGLEALGADFEVHSPGRSFHAARPIAALDRIAVNKHIELRDAGVHQSGQAGKASDHLPIWADLLTR